MKKNSINEIKKMTQKFPHTLKETIEYECNQNENNNLDNDEYREELEPEKETAPEMDVASFVDDIRKKALRGMAQLADNPESEEYQLLKKIWITTDRKPENKHENNLNN